MRERAEGSDGEAYRGGSDGDSGDEEPTEEEIEAYMAMEEARAEAGEGSDGEAGP